MASPTQKQHLKYKKRGEQGNQYPKYGWGIKNDFTRTVRDGIHDHGRT